MVEVVLNIHPNWFDTAEYLLRYVSSLYVRCSAHQSGCSSCTKGSAGTCLSRHFVESKAHVRTYAGASIAYGAADGVSMDNAKKELVFLDTIYSVCLYQALGEQEIDSEARKIFGPDRAKVWVSWFCN